MQLLDANAGGSPERRDGRRCDMWVATGTDRRVTFFLPGRLYCPNGHRVPEKAKLFEGTGARLCEKKTPSSGPRGEHGHEGICNTWIYILAGLRAFNDEDAAVLHVAVEVTPRELREISGRNMRTLEAVEFLGLFAWTRR